MAPKASCPQCGAPLPPDAPVGLCPKCLLAAGLAEAGTDKTPRVLPTVGLDDAADGEGGEAKSGAGNAPDLLNDGLRPGTFTPGGSSTPVSHSTTCPECGAPLPVDRPAGVCPKCLVQAGRGEVSADTAATEAAAHPSRRTRPDGEAVPAPSESRLQDAERRERRERLIGAALLATAGAVLSGAVAWWEDLGAAAIAASGVCVFAFVFVLFAGFLQRPFLSASRARRIGAVLLAIVGAFLIGSVAWTDDNPGIGEVIALGAFGFVFIVFIFALFSGRPRFLGLTLITLGAFCALIAAWAFFDDAPLRIGLRWGLQGAAFVCIGHVFIRKGKSIHRENESNSPA